MTGWIALRQPSGEYPELTGIRHSPGFLPCLIALPSVSARPWAGLDRFRRGAEVFAGDPWVTTIEPITG